MTEGKKTSKAGKKLLALNPSEDAEFQKKVQQVKTRQKTVLSPGVVYVGHIPHSLAEPQLRAYFSQFGKVLRLRMARSKRTGRSRGFAFVEFECDEVAKIVAEAMDNYLMGERLIKCHVVPPENVHENLFVGSEKIFVKPTQPIRARYNRSHDPKNMKKLTKKLLSNESKLRKRLAEKGIDYDFPGFAAQAKKSQSDANTSICNEDVTPVCTPSVLEKRRTTTTEEQDDDDDEIVLKTQPTSENDVENCDETTEEEEECEDSDGSGDDDA
ncbi:MKI67 FHA domain-interacting nucleolar phosphoprotein [Brachyhypopomus gauderio]|uniref:MKI67 FHA domain-interacting nucleolar phosphoprotein n=1 Tax=Brachyhypopomus gauderio TaxID=698409 RepID=UPI004041FA6B